MTHPTIGKIEEKINYEKDPLSSRSMNFVNLIFCFRRELLWDP